MVACEYSGRVRDAFAAKGHDVTSCDFLPSRTPGKHYQGDVKDILHDGWDMLIGFPPCTYLSKVGAKWRANIDRFKKAIQAMDFFVELYTAPIERISLENPVGMLNVCFRPPDQIIQPYYFGGNEKKTTCLWLQNLPPLVHTKTDNLFEKSTHGVLSEAFISKKPHGQTEWYSNNKKERSTLFPAISQAMADQWSF